MSIWGGSTSRDLLNVSSKNTHCIELNYSARLVLLHAWQTPMYQRPQFNPLKQRIRAPRRFISAVVGPRQVGENTRGATG